ncbi:hypothetical protein [Streptomyces sp. NPDC002547]
MPLGSQPRIAHGTVFLVCGVPTGAGPGLLSKGSITTLLASVSVTRPHRLPN